MQKTFIKIKKQFYKLEKGGQFTLNYKNLFCKKQ